MILYFLHIALQIAAAIAHNEPPLSRLNRAALGGWGR